MLNINKTVENGNAVFKLEGRLDTVTAPELEQTLREALPGLNKLTLDFEKLEYISSAGLRVLLAAHRLLGGQGLTIVNVNEIVGEVFEITGFSDFLTIE